MGVSSWRSGSDRFTPSMLRRTRVLRHLRAIMNDPREKVVYDTETTGLESTDEICEVGVVDLEGNVLFQSLVRPLCAISAKARAVHGISDAELRDAPDFPAIASRLDAVLAGKRVLTYNAGFDLRLTTQSAKAHRVAYMECLSPLTEWECLMLAYSEWKGIWSAYHDAWSFQPLDSACPALGVKQGKSHRAAADALSALGVFHALLALETLLPPEPPVIEDEAFF